MMERPLTPRQAQAAKAAHRTIERGYRLAKRAREAAEAIAGTEGKARERAFKRAGALAQRADEAIAAAKRLNLQAMDS